MALSLHHFRKVLPATGSTLCRLNILSLAPKGDFDLCSPVMEANQKCVQCNEKIMYYLAQMVRYPYDFKKLIYSSQLVQADCIRSNVEHMRRARGRCMGSAYWQVNDSNPVISWSSIDYFGRWKGLHYYAKLPKLGMRVRFPLLAPNS